MEVFIKCVYDCVWLSMTACCRYWPDMSLSLVSPLIMMVTVQPPPVLASVIASRNYTQIEQL